MTGRLRVLAALATILALSLASGAAADPQFKDGMSPHGTGCDAPSSTVRTLAEKDIKLPGIVGTVGHIALRYSSRCGEAWTSVVTQLGAPGTASYTADPVIWHGGHKNVAVGTAQDTFRPDASGTQKTFTGMIEARGVSVCAGTNIYNNYGFMGYSFLLCTAPGRGTSPGHASVGPTPYGVASRAVYGPGNIAGGGSVFGTPATGTPTVPAGDDTPTGGGAPGTSGPPAGSGPPTGASMTISQGGAFGCNGCYAVDVAVHSFPTGTYTYTCHDNSGPGGSDSAFYSHAVTVTDPNQSSWPGVFCYNSPPYRTYVTMAGVTSNTVQFAAAASPPPPPPPPPPAPASISAARGGVYGCGVCHTLDVAVHNFPTGTYTYACHDNSGPGGSDIVFYSHAVAVTDPNQGSWPGVFCYDSAPYVAYVVINGIRSNSVQF